jgi:hypothetical protein
MLDAIVQRGQMRSILARLVTMLHRQDAKGAAPRPKGVARVRK